VSSLHGAGVWRVVALILLGLALLGGAHSKPASTTAGDSATYVGAARSIAHGDGYSTEFGTETVPRYPPGLSFLLVPAAVVTSGDWAMQATALLLGLLLIAAIWKCAHAIGGYPAAAGAGLLLLASPGVLHSGSAIMSDGPAALLLVAALFFVATGRMRCAGVALGLACVVRLNAVFFVPGLRRRRAVVIALATIGSLAVFQLAVHGNVRGYSGGEASFGFGYLTHGTVLETAGNRSPDPNWRFYPEVLFGAGRLLVVGAPALAGYGLWRRRAEPVAQTAAWVVASTFAIYLVYYFQSWRFLLPVFVIAIIFGGVALGDLGQAIARERTISRWRRVARRVETVSVSAPSTIASTAASKPTS
jgi:4-amino-4-deoxy-L-arabinose transferase-like glycosyltransferase